MKNKFILTLILSILLSTKIITSTPLAFTNNLNIQLPCSCEDSSDPACQKEHERHTKNKVTIWTEKNINLLSKDEQKKLYDIQEKLQKGETLSNNDKEQLMQLKDIIAKHKLGEKDFENFKSLMSKKYNGEHLSDEDYLQLKGYLKKIFY